MDVVGQYKNRFEIYTNVAEIKPLHAHLNHLVENDKFILPK